MARSFFGRSPGAVAALLLLAFWSISLSVVGVSGEFPLFDDWAYTRAVGHLLEHGFLRLDDAQAILLLPQIATGWLLTSITGFSFVSLRLVGIASAVLAAAAVYQATRFAGAQQVTASAAAMAMSVNPVLHVSAYSFLSDGPTTALSAAAVAAYVLAQRKGSPSWWVAAAIVLAIATVLNRQSAMALVLGFAAGWAAPPITLRRVALAIAVIVFAILALVACERLVLAHQGTLPTAYTGRAGEPGAMVTSLLAFPAVRQVAWAFVRQVLYLGLFALPMLVVSRRSPGRLGGGFAAALGFVLIAADRHLPLLGGLLYADGLGPVMIQGQPTSNLSVSFWWVATAAALLGTAGLVDTVASAFRRIVDLRTEREWATRIRIACLVTIGGLTTLHALIGPFDRHLLVAVPCVLLLIALEAPAEIASSSRRTASGLVGVAFGTFAIVATRDCLEWERARWDVLRQIEASGVSPLTMDGGLEYNRYQTGRTGTPTRGTETHHVSFVHEMPANATRCATYDAWLGPRAAAICAMPGPGPTELR